MAQTATDVQITRNLRYISEHTDPPNEAGCIRWNTPTPQGRIPGIAAHRSSTTVARFLFNLNLEAQGLPILERKDNIKRTCQDQLCCTLAHMYTPASETALHNRETAQAFESVRGMEFQDMINHWRTYPKDPQMGPIPDDETPEQAYLRRTEYENRKAIGNDLCYPWHGPTERGNPIVPRWNEDGTFEAVSAGYELLLFKQDPNDGSKPMPPWGYVSHTCGHRWCMNSRHLRPIYNHPKNKGIKDDSYQRALEAIEWVNGEESG